MIPNNYTNLLHSTLGAVHNAGYSMLSGNPEPFVRSARAVSESMATVIDMPDSDDETQLDSRCHRFTHFLRRNKMLVAMGVATIAFASYLLSKHRSPESSEYNNTDDSGDDAYASSLVGGRPITESTPVRAVRISMGCTGSAIAEDWILTAAHCVAEVDKSDGLSCKFPNGTAVPSELLSQTPTYEAGGDYDYNYDFDAATSSPDSFAFSDMSLTEPELAEDPRLAYNMTCEPYPMKYMPASNITVRYESHINKDAGANHYQAIKVVVHPGYTDSDDDIYSDIALIKLDRSIPNIPLSVLPSAQTNANFRAQIQANGDGSAPKYRRNMYTQGWGIERNPDFSGSVDDILNRVPNFRSPKTLKEGNLTAVAQDTESGLDCERLVCAFEPSTEICTGDSGGPAYFYDPEAKELVQVGVSSESSEGCSHGQSYFSDVYQNKAWIEQTMQSLGSDTAAHRTRLHQQRASSDFKDRWDPDNERFTRIDCSEAKIENLKNATLSAMEEAKQCNIETDTSNCQTQSEKLAGYRQAFGFRLDQCIKDNKHANNKEGLKILQRWDLESDSSTKPKYCLLINKNNKDVLKFTPQADSSKATIVLPKRTVHCPEVNGVPMTEGRVTRVRDQIGAALKSEKGFKPKYKQLGASVRLEREAKHANFMASQTCTLSNKGQTFTTFTPADGGAKVLLAPSASKPCSEDGRLDPSGSFASAEYIDFPEIKFEQMGRINESAGARIKVSADIDLTNNVFFLNNHQLSNPTQVSDWGDKKILTFSEEDIQKFDSVRLVDKRAVQSGFKN